LNVSTGDLALVRVQDLDEARHVRSLELCGRPTYMLNVATVCCTVARAFGDADGMADGLDADLVDGQLAPVLGALHVGMTSGSRIFMKSLSSRGSVLEDFNMRYVPTFFKTRADGGDDSRLVQPHGSEQLRLVAVIDEAVGKPSWRSGVTMARAVSASATPLPAPPKTAFSSMVTRSE